MSNKTRAILIAFSLLFFIVGIGINRIETALGSLLLFLMVSIDAMEDGR